MRRHFGSARLSSQRRRQNCCCHASWLNNYNSNRHLMQHLHGACVVAPLLVKWEGTLEVPGSAPRDEGRIVVVMAHVDMIFHRTWLKPFWVVNGVESWHMPRRPMPTQKPQSPSSAWFRSACAMPVSMRLWSNISSWMMGPFRSWANGALWWCCACSVCMYMRNWEGIFLLAIDMMRWTMYW